MEYTPFKDYIWTSHILICQVGDLSQPISCLELSEKQTDVRLPEGSNSIRVGTLKIKAKYADIVN